MLPLVHRCIVPSGYFAGLAGNREARRPWVVWREQGYSHLQVPQDHVHLPLPQTVWPLAGGTSFVSGRHRPRSPPWRGTVRQLCGVHAQGAPPSAILKLSWSAPAGVHARVHVLSLLGQDCQVLVTSAPPTATNTSKAIYLTVACSWQSEPPPSNNHTHCRRLHHPRPGWLFPVSAHPPHVSEPPAPCPKNGQDSSVFET